MGILIQADEIKKIQRLGILAEDPQNVVKSRARDGQVQQLHGCYLE
jgi:hypothetical protein